MPVPPIALTRSSTARVEIPLMSFVGLRGLRPRSASPSMTAVSAFSAVRRGSRSEGAVAKALIDPADRPKTRTGSRSPCAASGCRDQSAQPGSVGNRHAISNPPHPRLSHSGHSCKSCDPRSGHREPRAHNELHKQKPLAVVAGELAGPRSGHLLRAAPLVRARPGRTL
jgi:hypothetical protein